MKKIFFNGTSVEVLAPFLPYGLRLQGSHGRGALLTGLNYAHPHQVGLAWDNIDGTPDGTPDNGSYYNDAAIVMPVLFSFEDLVTPQPTGSIPAVELAVILTIDSELYEATASYWPVEHDEDGEAYILVSGRNFEGEKVEMTLYESWDWDGPRVGYGHVEAVDYLRRNHFAVGLHDNQFIRKSKLPK